MDDIEKAKRPSLAMRQLKQNNRMKKGSLRKKNSLYFKPGFEVNLTEDQDIRKIAKERLEKGQTLKLKKGTLRLKSIYSAKKNSIYQEGTLEHKLSTMMGAVYSELHSEDDGTETAEREKEKRRQDEQYYHLMKRDPAYSKFKAKCRENAKQEFESFYNQAEKEITEIEKMFGVDDESLQKLEVEIRATMKANEEAKEKAEKEAKEKAEKEAKEKAEKEAKEKTEKEAKEKAEKEAKEKAEKEAKEKAEKEAEEKTEQETAPTPPKADEVADPATEKDV